MKTAQEMYKEAFDFILKRNKHRIDDIERQIQEEVNEGYFSCELTLYGVGNDYEVILAYLRQLGYIIDGSPVISGASDYTIKIRWRG